jgi:hypothetical protein
LGLTEIAQEPATSDGDIDDGSDSIDPFSEVFAKDGLVALGGEHLERVHSSGITTIVTPCLSKGFLEGASVAFRSGARNGNDFHFPPAFY